VRAFTGEPPRFLGAERDASLEKIDLDIFGCLRKKLQLDLGIRTRSALEDRARQIWMKSLECAHGVQRCAPQSRDALGMLLGLIKRAVRMQLRLDLVVSR